MVDFDQAIRAGQWQEALSQLGSVRNVLNFNRSMSAAARAHGWTACLALLEEMLSLQLEADGFSYAAAIKSCAGNWPLALKLLTHWPHDTVCFNSAMPQMPWTLALELLRVMASTEVCPDAITYGSALAACKRLAQWQQGLQLLEDVREKQMSNEIIENTAMGACAQASAWPMVLQLLDDMRSDDRSCSFAMSTTAIRACAVAGEWRQALSLLELMPELDLKPNTISFNCFLSACFTNWPTALAALQRMAALHVEMDLITYNSALSSLKQGLSWEIALALLLDLKGRHLEPDALTYNSTMKACRSWPMAVALLEEMASAGVKRSKISFGTAISACESVSAWAPALALLSELYRSQLTPDGRIIGSVACSLPDRRRALALLSGLWRPCGAQAPSVPGQLACGQGLVMLCKPSQQRTEDLVATLGRPVTVVSRLDSPTSGVLPVVLAAPTSRVASCFEAQFAGRMVDKDYVCLCEGAPMGVAGTCGEVNAPLSTVRHGQNVRSQVDSQGKAAKTLYWLRARYHSERGGELMLCHVKPLTGRTHQIRVHFASQGRPLVGDAAYGTGLIFSRLFLHCRRLALRDASGKRVVGKAKLPNELQELLGQLRSIQERPGHWS